MLLFPKLLNLNFMEQTSYTVSQQHMETAVHYVQTLNLCVSFEFGLYSFPPFQNQFSDFWWNIIHFIIIIICNSWTEVESVGVSRNRRRKNIVKFSFWIDSNETKPHLPNYISHCNILEHKIKQWLSKTYHGFLCARKFRLRINSREFLLSQVFSATALRESVNRKSLCEIGEVFIGSNWELLN